MSALFVILVALFFAGVPIALSLGIAPLATLVQKGIPLISIPQAVFDSLDSFALMALPLFVLAGRLMQFGGIAQRLIGLAVALVGWLPGALGAAVVLTSMLFAAISGSSAATAAAIGGVLIPEMRRKGYPVSFSAAATASSGELGVIIPPSVPMIIYGVVTGVSISDIFIGGILPGLLIGGSLILYVVIASAWRGYGENAPFSLREWPMQVVASFREAFLSLMMPFIILGGIFGGFFTATEAAVVAVIYALFLGVVIYRRISLRDLPHLFADAAVTSATVMVIVAFAAMFAFAMTILKVPQEIGALLTSITTNPLFFLMLVNGLLLIVGMFMEPLAAILILAPILAPIAVGYGIDPVHFGIIVIVNLAIGMVTPPVGINLFIACGIARISIEQLVRPLAAFLAILVADLLVITYMPELSLALLR